MYELTQRDTVLSVSAERPFNRYTLTYTADVPLCGTLVYEIDGAECRAEDFFLEGIPQTSLMTCFDIHIHVPPKVIST